jgi:anti-sigma factor RsiW
MKHVGDLIQAYLSGELDGGRAAAVEKHLEGCSRCRQEAQEARALWKMLGSTETVPTGNDSIWPAVQARTLGRDPEPREWFFGTGPRMRAGLAAVALAAGLMVGVLLPVGSDPSPATDDSLASSAWLLDSSWLSGSSWLATEKGAGLDDILLGTDQSEEGNGS